MQTVAELPSDKTPGKGEGYSLVRQRGGDGGETERVRGESGGDGRTEHETLWPREVSLLSTLVWYVWFGWGSPLLFDLSAFYHAASLAYFQHFLAIRTFKSNKNIQLRVSVYTYKVTLTQFSPSISHQVFILAKSDVYAISVVHRSPGFISALFFGEVCGCVYLMVRHGMALVTLSLLM